MSAGASERRGTLLGGREDAPAGDGLGAHAGSQPRTQPLSFTGTATPDVTGGSQGSGQGHPGCTGTNPNADSSDVSHRR